MKQQNVTQLLNNYQYLGDLTDKEFLSAKCLTTATYLVLDFRGVAIYANNNWVPIPLNQIQLGQNIAIAGAFQHMIKSEQPVSGSFIIEQVCDIVITNTDFTLIGKNGRICYTTLDCYPELCALSNIVKKNMFDKNMIAQMLNGTELSDWVTTRNEIQKTYTREQSQGIDLGLFR